MDIISKKQAKLNKQRFYFTGEPCVNGNVNNRRVVNGMCQCDVCKDQEKLARKDYYAQWRADPENKKLMLSQIKEWSNKNKDCVRKYSKNWIKNNPEKVSEQSRNWRIKNPNRMKELIGNWNLAHPEKMKQYRQTEGTKKARRKWNQANKGVLNFHCRMRQKLIKQATPAWANLAVIRKLYVECSARSEQENVSYHVDHIVPIKGKNVCGLHVDYNLQIIPKSVNLSKGNKY